MKEVDLNRLLRKAQVLTPELVDKRSCHEVNESLKALRYPDTCEALLINRYIEQGSPLIPQNVIGELR